MEDLEKYCFHLSRSQEMSDLRAKRGNYDNMSILRGVELSIRPSIETLIIRMPPDGVLLF